MNLPPPRQSRLRKAALTLLAAATAAAFVCAPAGAAAPDPPPPIEITEMTVSHDNVIEGYMHTTTIKTNIDFAKVEWYIDDEENPSKTHVGPASSDAYERAYTHNDGFGGPRGKTHKITAKVTDANDFTASRSIFFNIWSSTDAINIISKTPDARIAEDNFLNLVIETDVGFWYVDWYVDEKYQKTDGGPALRSRLPWTFSSGDPDGNVVKVKAIVYGINTNGPLPSDDDEITVTVFDGYGFQWRRMISRVESFSKVLNHEYIFTSGHTIEYYYDGRPHTFRLRRKSGWYENGNAQELKWPEDSPFLAVAIFWESVTLPMDISQTLTPNKEYHVFAYTNFGAGNAPAEVFSEKARYDPLAADPLPIPTGTEAESENPNLPDVLK